MLNVASKSRSVVAVLLILSVLLVMFLGDDFDSFVVSTTLSINDASGECAETLLSADSSNGVSEYYIRQVTARRRIVTSRNRIKMFQEVSQYKTNINFGTAIISFYILMCAIAVRIIVKYIYRADGKK